MSLCSYCNASLRAPPESRDAQEDERVSWDWGEALIDNVAYMIQETNHTTAYFPFTTLSGVKEQLQVTFCLLPPPHISYFCISYTSGEGTRFVREPRILATQGNLALICVNQGLYPFPRSTDYNFFVYHAPTIRGHDHETPTLQLIPHPKPDFFPWNKYCYFTRGQTGILLRYRTSTSGRNKQQSPFTPTLSLTHALARRHKSPFTAHTNKEELDAFKIATLCTRFDESGIVHYDIFSYDSKANWTCERTTFSSQERPQSFASDRVIMVSGTMVFVDLSHGMLLCDLQQEASPRQLRYIQLPKPVQPRDNFPLCVSSSSFSRDIAVVDDRIKFVDLEIHCPSSQGLPYCWTAVTWSMSVGDDSQFQKDGEVKSTDIASSDAALDLRSLFVAHPSLSSHHADILYLMAKPNLALGDPDSTILALHMKNKTVERIAKYTTQRIGTMDFAYMLTTITKYLAPPGDSKANIRKRGPASLGGTSRRKAPAFALKSGLVQMEEEEEDHSNKPPAMDDYGDNMDLE